MASTPARAIWATPHCDTTGSSSEETPSASFASSADVVLLEPLTRAPSSVRDGQPRSVGEHVQKGMQAATDSAGYFMLTLGAIGGERLLPTSNSLRGAMGWADRRAMSRHARDRSL